jgi:RNA polymerase sigma-70 factor (ECF subfamily)
VWSAPPLRTRPVLDALEYLPCSAANEFGERLSRQGGLNSRVYSVAVRYNPGTLEAQLAVDYKQLSPADLIRCCLRTGEEPAWAEFMRRFHPLIAGVVVRMARRWGEPSPEILDDLIQETYLKLCVDREQVLDNFHPAHPDAIFGFIKVFTANLVYDHFKALHSDKRGGGLKSNSTDDTTLKLNPVLDRSAPESIERTVLLSEIDTCLSGVTNGPNTLRDRHIFWLYYRVGLSASAIAALPTIGLNTKGVESTIFRLTRVVRQRLSTTATSTNPDAILEKGIRPAESL